MTEMAPAAARVVALVVFPGAQLFDAAGPAEVFAMANSQAPALAYDVRFVSNHVGAVPMSVGALWSEPLDSLDTLIVDTLFVVGGVEEAIVGALRDPVLKRWIRDRGAKVRRLASVCSGVFILSALGLADGRRVATHWSAAERLAQANPRLLVDPESLFVAAGGLWTSAGVSTGVDMALAMVAADLGPDIAHKTAQQLVVSVRRPGHQSQFSPALDLQRRAGEPLGNLVGWMQVNLSARLDVPTLAERAGMSERTFQRKFAKAVGVPPAEMVERMRVDGARVLLRSDLPLKAIAAGVGFASSTQLAAAFLRRTGLTPRAYRELHAQPGPGGVRAEETRPPSPRPLPRPRRPA